MFQYAAGKSLAAYHATEFFIDTMVYDQFKIRRKERQYELSHFLIRNFKKPNQFIFQQFRNNYNIGETLRYNEPHFHFDPNFFKLPDNTHLIGFWQSEKYFKNIKSTIYEDFDFNKVKNISGSNSAYLRKINETNSVSIHVRRGDYVTNSEYNKIHGTTNENYYKSAVEHIYKNLDSPHFYIFSDDINWVKENLEFPGSYQYIEANTGRSAIFDMWLMSTCKHNIIANSSFSWWAAWLNSNENKMVIAPSKWFQSIEHDTSDVIPPHWIKI